MVVIWKCWLQHNFCAQGVHFFYNPQIFKSSYEGEELIRLHPAISISSSKFNGSYFRDGFLFFFFPVEVPRSSTCIPQDTWYGSSTQFNWVFSACRREGSGTKWPAERQQVPGELASTGSHWDTQNALTSAGGRRDTSKRKECLGCSPGGGVLCFLSQH